MDRLLNLYADLVNAPLFIALFTAALGFAALLAILSHVNTAPVQDPIRMLQRTMKSERIPYFWFFFFAMLWMAIFLVLLFGLIAELTLLFLTETPSGTDTEAGRIATSELRFHLTKITALTAVLGAVVAFPFTVIRIQLSERQTYISEEGMITDRLNKAVENLGAFRSRHVTEGCEVSEPNLEVRIGAIFAISRIAEDNPSNTLQCMRILAAYVQENATRDTDRNDSRRTAYQLGLFNNLGNVQDHEAPKSGLLRKDVELAIDFGVQLQRTAGQKRKEPEWEFDLSRTNFSHAVVLSSFERCNLKLCDFENAILIGTDLIECATNLSNFCGTNFGNADCSGSLFNSGRFSEETVFSRVNLRGALFRNCDLSTTYLNPKQLEECYGDQTVVLPPNFVRPKHWSKRKLNNAQMEKRWAAYKRHIGYKTLG